MMMANGPGEDQGGALVPRLTLLRPRLHRYCARMAGSVVDGEDVVQDTMMKAIRAHADAGSIDNLEAWVFQIAHNTALDFLRRRAGELKHLSGENAEMVADPSADAAQRIAASAALRTFMELPPVERGSVILMDVLGYSLEEIGSTLQATLPTIKAALHRGRRRLRQLSADQPASPHHTLDGTERRKLQAYIDLFNARQFDAIRVMLAEDVRLDLVSRFRTSGRTEVSNYFSNYSGISDWYFVAGTLEGRPAAIMRAGDGTIRYAVLLAWNGEAVGAIHDFRYAPYAMEKAEIEVLE